MGHLADVEGAATLSIIKPERERFAQRTGVEEQTRMSYWIIACTGDGDELFDWPEGKVIALHPAPGRVVALVRAEEPAVAALRLTAAAVSWVRPVANPPGLEGLHVA
jgi:hypothetical protein